MAETTRDGGSIDDVNEMRTRAQELEEQIRKTKAKIAAWSRTRSRVASRGSPNSIDALIRAAETKLVGLGLEASLARVGLESSLAKASEVERLKTCHELVAGAYAKVLKLVAASDDMRRLHDSTAASHSAKEINLLVFIDALREYPLVSLDSF